VLLRAWQRGDFDRDGMPNHTARKLIAALLLLAMALGLPSCSDLLTFLDTPGPAPTATGAPVASAQPSPTRPAGAATPSGNATRAPEAITVWLPPQFDAAGSDPAAVLLQQRMDDFARRKNILVNTRIKAAQGPGGLLDSLSAASAAAPEALPDLIALPRADFETAALKGLLTAFPATDDPDWFAYAAEMARIQGTAFGLPLAGDALVLLYRPAGVTGQPASWGEVFAASDPLIFPSADPQALFTLSLYQSAGGPLLDDQRRPTLLNEPLRNVLAMVETGVRSGKLQPWLTGVESDNQAWVAFTEGRANWVVTWASRYLRDLPADTALMPALPVEGQPFTYASGWVLALTAGDSARRPLAGELAQSLTESEFLATWTAAAGMLPTR
jgi:ABC-type glycerol-3-phosphate transport system substrate-binding protein